MVKYTEDTFKNSKWTSFHQLLCHGQKIPYEFVYIQAPTGVAKDIFKKVFNLDPDATYCHQHEDGFMLGENTEPMEWLFNASNTVTMCIIRHDSIPYIMGDIWKYPQWRKEEDGPDL